MNSRWLSLVLLLPLLAHAASMPLHTGWKLQSGCVVKSTGEQISLTRYRPTGWIDAVVPGTVLASQVAAGIFPDPFFGMNLRKIPGTDYPVGKIFGYLPMSESSPTAAPGGTARSGLRPQPPERSPGCISTALTTARTFG
jgi:exo-1,4-beta-D-glucosaminidase